MWGYQFKLNVLIPGVGIQQRGCWTRTRWTLMNNRNVFVSPLNTLSWQRCLSYRVFLALNKIHQLRCDIVWETCRVALNLILYSLSSGVIAIFSPLSVTFFNTIGLLDAKDPSFVNRLMQTYTLLNRVRWITFLGLISSLLLWNHDRKETESNKATFCKGTSAGNNMSLHLHTEEVIEPCVKQNALSSEWWQTLV